LGFLLVIVTLCSLIFAIRPTVRWYTDHAIRLEWEAAARRIRPPKSPSKAEIEHEVVMRKLVSQLPAQPQCSFMDAFFAHEKAKAIAEIEKVGGKVIADENKGIISVDLKQTNATDAVMENLSSFVFFHLQSLDLRTTKVTDAGLVNLKGLYQLESLHLERTNVTVAGVKGLQKSLPNCTIFSHP
jgi:hypothetical protein